MANRDDSEFTFASMGRICAALREDGNSPKFIELLMILVIAENTASLHFSSADEISTTIYSITCHSSIQMSKVELNSKAGFPLNE